LATDLKSFLIGGLILTCDIIRCCPIPYIYLFSFPFLSILQNINFIHLFEDSLIYFRRQVISPTWHFFRVTFRQLNIIFRRYIEPCYLTKISQVVWCWVKQGFFTICILFVCPLFLIQRKRLNCKQNTRSQHLSRWDSIYQWKIINCKQNTRWQHLSKASAFLFGNFLLGVKKHNNLYLRLITPSSGW
jgi:hypothetical protein